MLSTCGQLSCFDLVAVIFLRDLSVGKTYQMKFRDIGVDSWAVGMKDEFMAENVRFQQLYRRQISYLHDSQ